MSLHHVEDFFRRYTDDNMRCLCWELHKLDFGSVPTQWMKHQPSRQDLLAWVDKHYIYSAFKRCWMTRRPLSHRQFIMPQFGR
jgi:hypothetical protein